jgi:predicted metal-dependent hydrolase
MQYQIKESSRARNVRITVSSDGTVTLTKPLRLSLDRATTFLQSRISWIHTIQKRLTERQKRQEKLYGASIQLPRLRRTTAAYKEAQKNARKLVTPLVHEIATQGGFIYTGISIRNQKTRWGSCSSRNALSFNYRLIYLSKEELEYLVVHELAHTKHHNHGKEFWAEVEQFVPNCKQLRSSLRRYRW